MTCSRNFRRVLQTGCLGLIGALTVVGCGGSENKPTVPDGSTGGIDGGPGKLANLTANPTTVPLGSVDVGKTSTPATVKITNSGTAASTVTVTPTGVGISASGCAGSLAIGASCDITIIATPTAPGAIVGSVAVAAANGNTIGISVTGTAVVPGAFTVAPNTIPLGDLVVGATVPVSVTVTATAAITAGLTTGVQGGDLVVNTTGSTCTGALAAGASCVVAATFTATAAGSPTNDAIVVSQGGVSKSVPVTANVLTPAKLAATPAKADLTATPGSPSTSLDINIGNIGGMTTGQLAVAITGTSFKIVSEACSVVTLAASKFCTVTVAYQPAASVIAAETGSLTVTDKAAGGSVATVALTGTPNISGLALSGGPALGSVAPGATGTEVVFTVTNTAAAPTGALTAAVGSTLVTISSNTCATKATLNKGDTCTLGLKLAPPVGTAAQAIAGLLTVTSAAGSASASFTGSVVTPSTLTAAPTSISFGSIPANQSSAVQTVTITNIGATPTATLSVNLTGAGAAQVASTTTCTGTLAPAATCAVSVTFSPTDTTGVNGAIIVSDGSASVSVPMVGTGLGASILTVDPPSEDFGKVVVGYSSSASTVKVTLNATATGGSGTITAKTTGTAAAAFVLKNNTCTSLPAGSSCTLDVVFTPSAAGANTATLVLDAANGGHNEVALTGVGLSLVQLVPLDQNSTVTPAVTGLDFDMTPNGSVGPYHTYRVVVRGASDPTVTSTVATVALANAATTPDFTYVTCTGSTCTAATTNPCDGVTLTGLAATSTSRTGAGWNHTTSTADAAGTADALVTSGYWTCDFKVEFLPQSGKSTTAKTAKINASGSAGGSDSLTLSGISSGPLTITPATASFSTPVALGTDLTGPSDAGTSIDVRTFVVTNKTVTGGIAQGKLDAVLSGANVGDFVMFQDACTGTSLTVGASCNIVVGFAPTSVGTKNATLTVTASSTGETVSATITGAANAGAPVTVSPSPSDFGSVAQDNYGDWKTFTISNPAAGSQTGHLTYTLANTTSGSVTGMDFQLYSLSVAGVTSYPAGACGQSGQKALNPGETCTIQVRFAPRNTVGVSVARGATLTISDDASTPLAVAPVALSGTATAQLALSGANVALDTNGHQSIAFGTVSASGGTSAKSVTITNNGTEQAVLDAIALGTGTTAGFSFATGSTCALASGVLTLQPSASCQLNLLFTGSAGLSGSTVNPQITFGATGATPSEVISTPLYFSATVATPAALALYGLADYSGSNPIELGAAGIGTSTGIVTLTFKNTGGVAATGLQSSWNDATAGFTVVSESPGTCLSVGSVDALKTCTVNVRCVPASVGSKPSTLSLFGVGVTAATVNVHATGITTSNSVYAVPLAGGTDTVYSFGSTASFTGTAPAANTVSYTLHNNTATDLVFGTDVKVVGVGATSGFSSTVPSDGTGCATVAKNGGTCVFTVVFNPAWVSTDTLYRYAAVALTAAVQPIGTAGAGAVDNIVGLFGQAKQPAKLQLSATSTSSVTVAGTSPNFTADFGQLLSGQTPSLTFTITNIGELPSAGQVGLSFAAGATATFATIGTSTCGANLTAGASCTVVVNSQLASVGPQLQDLVVSATDGTVTAEKSAENYTLKANVVNPISLTLTPTATTFATATPAGTKDTTESITITVVNGSAADNYGNRQQTPALAVTLSDSTDFAVVQDASSTCLNTATGLYYGLGAAVASSTALTAETCKIVVQFTPKSAASLSTIVTVAGAASTITLTGTGIGDLSISPSGATASPVAFTTSKEFTITNTGTASTGLLSANISGTSLAAFAIIKDDCYAPLSSSGTCKVTVTFIGTATATAQTATLQVTDGSAINVVSAVMSASL